jgi:polyisoprenoid-binding protein YceI
LSTAESPPAPSVRYSIDSKASNFTIRAFAGGMLSAFAHSPTIAVQNLHGDVKVSSPLEESGLRLVIPAASLTVTDDISSKDRSEIESKMREEVLDTESYPDIVYESSRMSSVQRLGEGFYSVVLNGALTLHGMTHEQPVPARVTLSGDVLRAAGEFSLRQGDYDIRPVTAAGGTVKLKDELKLSFNISARRQP